MSRHLSVGSQRPPSPNRAKFPYRVVYIGLGLVTLLALALGAFFGNSDGDSVALPAPLESIIPGPDDFVLPQAMLVVDLQAGYRAQIYVDGFPVPTSEVDFVEPTGVHRWQPRANSLVFSRWAPGNHEIRVLWDTLVGLPAPGEYTWMFRVQ